MVSICLGGGPRQSLLPLLTLISALFCSLEYNKLGEQTGVALGEALQANTSLQNLK